MLLPRSLRLACAGRAAQDPGIEDALMLDASVRIHGPDMAILTARSPILNRDANKHHDFRWIPLFTKVSGQCSSPPARRPCCSLSEPVPAPIS